MVKAIKEAIHITVNNPTLNRKIGKYNLQQYSMSSVLKQNHLTVATSSG